MKLENRKFLDDHRHVHTTLVKAGYMMGLSGEVRSGLVRVMNEEWQPGYTADLWCPNCVANMVQQVYRRYDQFLEEEAKQIAEKAQHAAAFTPEAIAEKAEELTGSMEPPGPEVSEGGEEPETDIAVPDPDPDPEPAPAPRPVQTKANFPSHKNGRRR